MSIATPSEQCQFSQFFRHLTQNSLIHLENGDARSAHCWCYLVRAINSYMYALYGQTYICVGIILVRLMERRFYFLGCQRTSCRYITIPSEGDGVVIYLRRFRSIRGLHHHSADLLDVPRGDSCNKKLFVGCSECVERKRACFLRNDAVSLLHNVSLQYHL